MKSILGLLSVCLISLAGRSEISTWTSQNGYEVEAEFVKVENGRVHLRKSDGEVVTPPFNVLVAGDQERVKILHLEAQKKAKEAAEKEEAERRAALLAKWKPGEIIPMTVADKWNSSYHVYIPGSFNPDAPPPLVFAFSPGGGGRGQLNAMKQSAEKAGWIVVGCDKLKNRNSGVDEDGIEDSLLKDVLEKVPHDKNRVYLSGFSGGAMRSYGIAARRQDVKFAGILAFGGWIGGKELQQKLDFPRGMAVAMVNGEEDRNANSWVESDTKVLKKDKCEVRHFSFPGKHTMAPPETIDEVIAWLDTQAQAK